MANREPYLTKEPFPTQCQRSLSPGRCNKAGGALPRGTPVNDRRHRQGRTNNLAHWQFNVRNVAASVNAKNGVAEQYGS